MDRLWRQHGDPGMFVFAVVPGEEGATELFGVLNAAEAFGKFRAVLQGLEMGFRIWVIIAYIRAAVGFGDAEVSQQVGYQLGLHTGATIGMQNQLASSNMLFFTALTNELGSQCTGLAISDHPADHVAAEDVQNHVQIKVAPGHRPLQ